MPNPVVAIVAGTVVSAAIQSRAQAKAAKSYGNSANSQTQAVMEMYYQTREDLEPYMKYGSAGLKKYYNLLETGPGEFEADPGYEFRLGEGTKAIDRLAAAKGETFSGKRGKALIDYAQDYASNEYSKFMNRYYKKLDAYGNLMTMGQAAAAKVGAAGQTAIGQSANIQMGAAEARASSYINQGDIWGNVATQAAGGLGSYGGAGRYSNVETIRGGEGGGYGF